MRIRKERSDEAWTLLRLRRKEKSQVGIAAVMFVYALRDQISMEETSWRLDATYSQYS